MIQITSDHSTSVAVIAVVFTHLTLGEDHDCINVLNVIVHTKLVDSISCARLSVGLNLSFRQEVDDKTDRG